jgi:hypothetical protein
MRLLAVIAALILTIICRPLAGSPPPRVPDGAEQPPSEDDWREAFASRASARYVADLRRESVGTALFRYATIARDDRLRHASRRPPVVPRVRRASFSIDDAAGAIRVPERPVYASPQTNTGGVISPDQPVTVTVPFGHGHVAMTNPAPVYYNAAQPGYAPRYFPDIRRAGDALLCGAPAWYLRWSTPSRRWRCLFRERGRVGVVRALTRDAGRTDESI